MSNNSTLNKSKIIATLDKEYNIFKKRMIVSISGQTPEYQTIDNSIVPVKNRSEYVNIVFQWYKDKMNLENDKFMNKQGRVQHYVFNFLRSSTNSNGVIGYLKRSEWDAIKYQKNGYVYKTQKERNNEEQAEQAKAKQNINALRKIESNYYKYKNNLNKLEKNPNAWKNINKNNLKRKSNQYKQNKNKLLYINTINEKNQKLTELLGQKNNEKLSPTNVKEACKILVPNSKLLIPRQTPYGLSRNTAPYQACKNTFDGHQSQGGKKAVPKKKPAAKKPVKKVAPKKKPVAKKPVKKAAPKKKPAAKKPVKKAAPKKKPAAKKPVKKVASKKKPATKKPVSKK